LVPYQSYPHADVIRAITVDGDQVYFRNMEKVFRVPLAGGAPASISATAGAILAADSHPTIWVVGDRLISQSPGDPAFLASPKAGGPWTPFIDLSKQKVSTNVSSHLLSELFKGSGSVHAHPAIFDGTSFYWIEASSGKKGKRDSWTIRTIPFAGGAARTVFESEGKLGSLAKAGDHLVFTHTEPAPAPEKPKAKHSAGKAKSTPIIPTVGPAMPTTLMSIPVVGGKADNLARISNLAGILAGNEVLLADGDKVYISGYADEDIMKPGLYRISTAGGPLERLDSRTMTGQGFVYNNNIVFVGPGMLEPREKVAPGDILASRGHIVLTGPRDAKSLERAACFQGNYTTHAYAVAGKTLLVSIFNDNDRTAGIIRIPLP
jgi:hypothetical protein